MRFRPLRARPRVNAKLPDDQLVGRFKSRWFPFHFITAWSLVYVVRNRNDDWCDAIIWSHAKDRIQESHALAGTTREQAEQKALAWLQDKADEGNVVQVVDRTPPARDA